MIELKPCPFCGGEPRQFTVAHGKIHGVDCPNCGIQVETVGDFSVPIWNRRESSGQPVDPQARRHAPTILAWMKNRGVEGADDLLALDWLRSLAHPETPTNKPEN